MNKMTSATALKSVCALAILFLFPASSSALASTTSSVGSPTVTKGEAEVAVRAGYSTADDKSGDDERFRSRVHLKYGFTDLYAVQIVVSQDKRKGDSFEHDGVKFENRFHILKKDQYGFDFGIRANYSLKDGDKKPDSAEIGFYELIPIDAYELRANQIFSHDVGSDAEDGVGAELRFQATRKFDAGYRLGLESFHDFGNLSDNEGYDEQSHTIGPVVKTDLLNLGQIEAGYRAGISEAAPDHSFKVFFSRKF